MSRSVRPMPLPRDATHPHTLYAPPGPGWRSAAAHASSQANRPMVPSPSPDPSPSASTASLASQLSPTVAHNALESVGVSSPSYRGAHRSESSRSRSSFSSSAAPPPGTRSLRPYSAIRTDELGQSDDLESESHDPGKDVIPDMCDRTGALASEVETMAVAAAEAEDQEALLDLDLGLPALPAIGPADPGADEPQDVVPGGPNDELTSISAPSLKPWNLFPIPSRPNPSPPAPENVQELLTKNEGPYDWTHFLAAYAKGRWDPYRPPRPPGLSSAKEGQRSSLTCTRKHDGRELSSSFVSCLALYV